MKTLMCAMFILVLSISSRGIAEINHVPCQGIDQGTVGKVLIP